MVRMSKGLRVEGGRDVGFGLFWQRAQLAEN